MSKTIKKNWPKYALQWGVLALLVIFITGLAKVVIPSLAAADPEKYCPMGGLQALTTFFVRGSLPCSMSTVQIVMGIALAAAVILFSKLFCAYLCPVGTVQDLVAKLRKKMHIKAAHIRGGSIADKVLRILKYALLFTIFYLTATSSELFCKHLDPYYAVATGFKGEITLWMAITSVSLVVVGGFIVDNFWCRYICPLGALSNSLKFWVWLLLLTAVWYVAGVCGLNIPWFYLLGALCLLGYLLEILCGKPKLQLLHIYKDENACNHCGSCTKTCPYHIDLDDCQNGIVRSVDCNLCLECTAVCPTKALKVGVCHKCKGGFWKYVPAILAVGLLGLGIWLGTLPQFELPTISETWGIEKMGPDSTVVQLVDPSTLKTMEMDGLKSVKCFGSSTAFKNKLMAIDGVHGVKTFVVHHRAIITYDPSKVDPETIQKEVFVPVKIRTDKSPELTPNNKIKVVTIHTDGMFDRIDLTYFGLQVRNMGKQIYGLESEFACPLIIRLYMAPEETLSEQEAREWVEKKELVTHNPTTGEAVKTIPVDWKFVDLVEQPEYITVKEYVEKMFEGFDSGIYNGRYTAADGSSFIEKRDVHYEGVPQYIYEIPGEDYDKPVFKRANVWMFLSNHVSREEGIISLQLALNNDLVPALQIRFCAPMTAEKLWNLINEDPWKITYAEDDVREVPARVKFETPGVVYPR